MFWRRRRSRARIRSIRVWLELTTRLLLIRHGQTAWNASARIQGQRDVPLDERGRWQAQRLAQHLKGGEPIDALVASPLRRAWETGQCLAQALGLPLQADARLGERSFGEFEGYTLDEAALRWPEAVARWRARQLHWSAPGGESAQVFIERSLAALAHWADCFAGKTWALVTHGGVLDVVYRHAQGLAWAAPHKVPMLNAAINWLEVLGVQPLALSVLEWGQVAHLDAANSGPVLGGHAP